MVLSKWIYEESLFSLFIFRSPNSSAFLLQCTYSSNFAESASVQLVQCGCLNCWHLQTHNLLSLVRQHTFSGLLSLSLTSLVCLLKHGAMRRQFLQ